MNKYTFVLCSQNQNKIREFRSIMTERVGELLGNGETEIEILSLSDIGFLDDIEENGKTFEENALIKARALSGFTKFPCIADDSGLEVDALGGEPGIYSARYAGEHGDDDKNIEKLLFKLSGIDNRSARFVTALAYCEGEREFVLRGEAKGKIMHERKGTGGFGYDSVFECAVHGVSFAELSSEEKNKISHRRRAIEKLTERLFKTEKNKVK